MIYCHYFLRPFLSLFYHLYLLAMVMDISARDHLLLSHMFSMLSSSGVLQRLTFIEADGCSRWCLGVVDAKRTARKVAWYNKMLVEIWQICRGFSGLATIGKSRNGGHAVKPPAPTSGIRSVPEDSVWTAKAAWGESHCDVCGMLEMQTPWCEV